MRRLGTLSWFLVLTLMPCEARHGVGVCGTSRESLNDAVFVHRRAAARARPLTAAAAAGSRDIGDIAIIDDSNGVVARQNDFNLDAKTLRFTPSNPNATQYAYAVSDGGYDSKAASAGSPLAALDDDDTRQMQLTFNFPFFGATYNQVFVNSDGNLTFGTGDSASSDRSLGRMTAGPPRISPLFDDLDPALTAGGVRMFSDATRVVISWVAVPEWQASGVGAKQTFQVTLYPDGSIAFSYSGIQASSAVVGIAPGNLKGSTTLVDFRNDSSGGYAAAVAERFGNSLQIDIITAAQKFYQTHDDAFDYLVFYNNMNVSALGQGVLSYESAVRVSASGYGLDPMDEGFQFGSPSRLQSVINMGALSNYPTDPNALVPVRAPQHDTPLTALAHEAGHLFLAFASVRDPNDPAAQPMLGYQGVHWSFAYDSEASLLEGERIADRGDSVSPRFMTTDITQAYSPLDQYLMGFRALDEVPDTFFVQGVPDYMTQWHQLSGVGLSGTRRDVSASEVAQVVGRRTPDYTVAQRKYRFAIVLIVAQGTQPSNAEMAKLDAFRQQFEGFFATASSGNAAADTSLRRGLQFSAFPGAGVVAGASANATLSIAAPAASDIAIQLQAPTGYAKAPASVTIAKGSSSASFAITGARAGVEELTATPADPAFDTAYARIQVADAALLKIVPISGDRQVSTSPSPLPEPIVVRVTDTNRLPYPGARITATASGDGSVSPSSATVDAQGQASFRWTPGSGSANQLHFSLDAIPSVGLTVSAGSAVPVAASIVNAATFDNAIAPGSLATIRGSKLSAGQTATAEAPWPASLGGVRVLLNGSAVPLLYVSDTQINFYIPADVTPGLVDLAVVPPSGAPANASIEIKPLAPGIFRGAVLHAGTAVSAVTTPVTAGDYIEIYCTGLGPTHSSGGFDLTAVTPVVFIGAIPVEPVYSGAVSGTPGLYQVNVQVPQGLAPGQQSLLISAGLAHSNTISIGVR